MKSEVKLKIADIVIQMQSRFALRQLTEKEKRIQVSERYDNFSYEGAEKPHILIDVEIVDRLPKVNNAKNVFITYHFQDGSENWRLLRKENSYIYKSPLKDKKQVMLVNKSFNRVKAYLLPKKDKGEVWNTTDIIYDFLQVLLINYFAQRNEGIFTHAIGVRNMDSRSTFAEATVDRFRGNDNKGGGERGLLFAGKSGCGKTAMAKIWHKDSRAMVLNDDRIIVRKNKDRFFIYGSPWHGEFSDYLASRIESAPLDRLFFIHHSAKNNVKKITEIQAFKLLYPAMFPTFWDKRCLENITSFCLDLVKTVPCFRMGFVNDKRIIGFVRNVR